jgi:hypothetical protein
MHVSNKEIIGVVDTAACYLHFLFEQIVPRCKLQGRIILKEADTFSEIEAILGQQIKIKIHIV